MEIPAYRIIISQNPETQSFVAFVPELPGCRVEAETGEEALAQVISEMEAQVHNMRESGRPVPEPVELGDYSGEITIKISSGLHQELAWQAAVEGVEMEQLLSELVASALERRRSARPRPRRAAGAGEERDQGAGEAQGQGRRRGGKERMSKSQYHDVMDDRASFIEYVRQLDPGGGRGGGGGGGRGGGGGGRGGGGGGGRGGGRRGPRGRKKG